MALEKRTSLDAAAVARLRKERDKLIQTTERLRAAREERDQAFRESDQPAKSATKIATKIKFFETYVSGVYI